MDGVDLCLPLHLPVPHPQMVWNGPDVKRDVIVFVADGDGASRPLIGQTVNKPALGPAAHEGCTQAEVASSRRPDKWCYSSRMALISPLMLFGMLGF